MMSPGYRQEIGNEAQLDFVLVNATWQSMAHGKWPAAAAAHYRQGADEILAKEGVDLHTMRLTSEGYVAK